MPSKLEAFMDYWFRPFSCEYESGWSTCCYNRLWYLLAVVDVVLLLFAFILGACEASHVIKPLHSIFWIVYVVAVVFLYALNLFQICYLPNAYPEDCERLYQELIHGKTVNKG